MTDRWLTSNTQVSHLTNSLSVPFYSSLILTDWWLISNTQVSHHTSSLSVPFYSSLIMTDWWLTCNTQVSHHTTCLSVPFYRSLIMTDWWSVSSTQQSSTWLTASPSSCSLRGQVPAQRGQAGSGHSILMQFAWDKLFSIYTETCILAQLNA